MSVFASALGAIFRDPNMAVDASHLSKRTGATVQVRVIRKRPDTQAEFNGGRFAYASELLDVPVSACPDLVAGDLFTIRGELFEVVGEPMRDTERLVWSAGIRAL